MARNTLFCALALFFFLGVCGPAAAQPDGWQAVIERVSDTEFLLEPEGLDKMLADPEWLARQGRVVPDYVDGQVVGFKLFGVRKGSFWALLGLKNGDVVRAVNGLTLESPGKALEAYQKIRGSSFVLDISRRGEPLRMTYNLRGQPKAAAPASLAPMPAAPASKAAPVADRPYEGGGRLRAHVSLDFGETPGDVTGTLRVMTDAPVVWSQMTGGATGGLPRIDFGRGEMVIRVTPGEAAPTIELVTLRVDDGDLAVKTDPKSQINFRPGAGLDGARLDLRMTLSAGPNATGAVADLLNAGGGMIMTCRGTLLSPRCRVEPPKGP